MPPRRADGYINPREARVRELWEAGCTLDEIAADIGTTRGCIQVLTAKMRGRGIELSYRRAGYAAVPFSAGTWEERRKLMAENRATAGQRSTMKAAWHRVLKADPCTYCGRPSTTVDHVAPWLYGGPDVDDNLVGACRRCNTAKHSHSLLTFLMLRRLAAERVEWMARTPRRQSAR